MKKSARVLPLFLSALLAVPLSGFAAEPVARNPQRTIPTKTLTVKIFSMLENDLLDAVQSKNMAAINMALSENFEMRTAAAPGRPIPREEFMRQALKEAPFGSTIRQMAAHELGDVIVVSFLWTLDVPKNSALAPQIFVVDTWKKVDANWRLVIRHASPAGIATQSVPGVPAVDATEPEIKKKI
jgi:hypothetical protein